MRASFAPGAQVDLSNPFEERGLTGELVLQTLALHHPPSVRQRRYAQTLIHA
jgi:hypothetical protein